MRAKQLVIFFYGMDRKNPGNQQTPVSWEFFDLQEDPSEMSNLYRRPEHAERIAKLKTQLRETRQALKETDQQYPDIQNVIEKHWMD